jgi:ankyrin repeat protein
LRVTDEYFPKTNPRSGGTIYQWTLGWYVSPHEVAKQFGHDDLYHLLMERSPADVKLIAACWAADEATVNTLVASHPGLVANLSPGYQRHVALAARNNNAIATRLMLSAGLPIDALGQHQATPLHWAAFHGNAPMAREILLHHPPLEITDADFKSTPLSWAIYGSEHGWYCESGDYAGTVELLLKAGGKRPEKIGDEFRMARHQGLHGRFLRGPASGDQFHIGRTALHEQMVQILVAKLLRHFMR